MSECEHWDSGLRKALLLKDSEQEGDVHLRCPVVQEEESGRRVL